MVIACLEHLKKFFDHDEIPCELLLKTEEIPIDQLYVQLDVDDQGRDFVLQLKIEEVSGDEEGDAKNPSDISLHFLQFVVALPYDVLPEQGSDVARLLLLINKSLELPGFELSEADGVAYYRYVLMSYTKKFHTKQLRSLLGTIMFTLDTYSEMIEGVASGGRSLESLVKEVIEA